MLPSTPNWPLSLLIGFLLAGCASGGIAFAAEYTDRSFRNADEVELFLNTPVLASLAVESGGGE
jgi:capsular polysaccharide biosynthesis protein